MDDHDTVFGEAGPSKAAFNDAKASTESLGAIDPDSFDTMVYEGTYKGRALITRYLHMSKVSSRQPSHPALAKIACLKLYPMIKDQTLDHKSYLNVMTKLHGICAGRSSAGTGAGMEVDGGSGQSEEMGVPDMEWVEETMEKERKEAAVLDVDLRGYMSNLIKESIRLTYLATAELAIKAGNFNGAIMNYTASREYSTSPQHHLDLGLGILETSLSFNYLSSLPGQIPRLETYLDRLYPAAGSSTTRTGADPSIITAGEVRENREREARGMSTRRKIGVKIRVAKGLVALGNKDYDRTGREFSQVGEDGGLGDWEGQVISTSDMCLVTALCVLATGSRDRIRQELLDRSSFRIGLDDTQGWILDLVRAFMDAQYGQVSSTLAKHEPFFLLTPFLYPHTQILINLIKSRSIVQYIEPFSSIRIDTMATAFGLSVANTLETIESLIKDGKVRGRIDLIDMVLTISSVDLRAQVYDRAFAVGKTILPQTHGALIRMKLHEAGINVDPRVHSNESKSPSAPLTAPLMGPTDSTDNLETAEGFHDAPEQFGFQDDDTMKDLSSDGEVA
ncbi:cop9 signalosome complex subunit 1 [Kockovaella imperatae]|uniref:Cop9 signalosome complex subunit 1 n=1 Tax=Kockovaella imperatae TaxID=4999 RepID=A0A1Y1UIZ9_9TREE|nr:cop9 signalosome complex subunit 1 [Kockovaella imperatae]ORX38038.1 cop9 signalosome complex subunit 1 [Kockovaella imperatae]